MKDNMIYWVWLSSARRMNTSKIKRALECFGTPKGVYDADIDALCQISGITSNDVKALNDKSISRAEHIMDSMQKAGVDILTMDSDKYPEPFRHIEKPPYVIYAKGTMPDWDSILSLTVIGTRKYSGYGADVTRFMCEPLAAAGFTIISGMASGVDGEAARAALKSGKETVAILGSGIDVIYPRENMELFDRITKNGVVMTEYPPGMRPYPQNFPQRNRLMSALGKGVLVVEAPARSGALITASQAMDMGKNVFAVPGYVFDENSAGCNMLIQQGAKAVMHPRDVMCEYFFDTSAVDGVMPKSYDSREDKKTAPVDYGGNNQESKNERRTYKKKSQKPHREENAAKKIEADINDGRFDELNETEKKIIALLAQKTYGTDELARTLEINISTLNNILVMLEIKGCITRLPGNSYKINT